MNKQGVLLSPVPKIEQVAALMLTVFKENPNTVMTRLEIESLVNVSEFSVSTRWRALNHLSCEGHIRQESQWPSSGPTTYKKED